MSLCGMTRGPLYRMGQSGVRQGGLGWTGAELNGAFKRSGAHTIRTHARADWDTKGTPIILGVCTSVLAH